MTPARVVVLISGGGSNLQCLIDASKAPNCPYEIVAVLSNRPHAGGLARAEAAGIAASALDHTCFQDREHFDQALYDKILEFAPDLVVCAGFMRVLTQGFVTKLEGRLINIHPSLLPSFRGVNTHARALEAGVAFAGCSVHWVNAGVDEGAIIGQAIVAVQAHDTQDTLAARILVQEHRLYPVCVSLVASGQAILKDGHTLINGTKRPLAMLPDGTLT